MPQFVLVLVGLLLIPYLVGAGISWIGYFVLSGLNFDIVLSSFGFYIDPLARYNEDMRLVGSWLYPSSHYNDDILLFTGLITIVITILLFIICFYLIGQKKKRREQEEWRIEQEKMRREKYKRIANESNNCISKLPNIANYVDTILARAQYNFDNRAFSPFWQEIENAAIELQEYHEKIQFLQHNVRECKDKIAKYPFLHPIVRLNFNTLPDVEPLIKKMKTLVRKAQSIYEFASIYEQRKTNKILTEGFSSLLQAIEQISFVLSESLDNLESELKWSIEKQTTEITESIDEQTSKSQELVGKQTAELTSSIDGQTTELKESIDGQTVELKRGN